MKRIIAFTLLTTILINSNVLVTAAMVTTATTEDCSICSEKIERSALASLACNHLFCPECIGGWIDKAAKRGKLDEARCPNCRQNIEIQDMPALGISPANISRFTEPAYVPAEDPDVRAHVALHHQFCINNRCGRPIARVAGSDVITCEYCGTQSCWYCNQPAEDLTHNAETCQLLGAVRRENDREIERRERGATPVMTETERVARANRPTSSINNRANTQRGNSRSSTTPATRKSGLSFARKRQIKQAIAVIALAAATIALYKFLNSESEEETKSKNKKDKAKKETLETVKA